MLRSPLLSRVRNLLVAAVVLLVFLAPSVANAAEMYRLYNPWTGEHFYTADTREREDLTIAGWVYEGVGWVAPNKSKTPVYRLYNRYVPGGDHHYTTSAAERDSLKKAGWKYEGIGWYSDDAKSVPLYRQYNPYAKTGTHNYTSDKAENDHLIAVGWRGEGVGWYGLSPKYSYEVFFLGDYATYTGWSRAIYVRTNNPDSSTFRLSVDGKTVNERLYSIYYDDVDYTGSAFKEVEGGYVFLFAPPRAGALTVQVMERTSDDYWAGKRAEVCVASYTVNVTQTSEEEWMRSVLAECTTDDMTPPEKMDALCEYLLTSQEEGGYGFMYPKNESGTSRPIYSIRDEGCPYYVKRRWNSFDSPAALCEFARLIGGFDDIHNCYDDYPFGTPQWSNTHYYCRVTYQGEEYLFMACPLERTGEVPAPEKIDFMNDADLYPFA